ncbi:MAG: hypothetical protein EYC70_03175 [Planctomycetota bacterium]|nr:MAG: hypothetical protein EYC70_03175 [Planctomycetota bacterium]
MSARVRVRLLRRVLAAACGLLLAWPAPVWAQGARGQDPPAPVTGGDWNEAGVAALAEARYDDAVAALENARRLLPDDATVRVNLARAYAFRGRSLLDAGRVPEALRDFGAGVAVDRDGGALETLSAEAHLRLGRREQAQAALDAVLRDFPDYLPAARLGAELAAVTGRLEAAIALLHAAATRHPEDAAVAARLAQLQEEKRALEGFLTDGSTHFDYRYDPHRPDLVAALPLLMEDLEAAYQAVAARLGLAPQDRILVLVLDRERYRGGAPEWSGGLYDGRIRLAVGDYRGERDGLQATLRHEYTHAALHRLGPPLPTWLHEGLAQWVEARAVAGARRSLRAGGALPELAALEGDWTSWTDRRKVQQAYDYALSLAAFLGEAYGAAVYGLLFENVRSLGFAAGAQRTFGKSLEDVDQEHRALLARSGGA